LIFVEIKQYPWFKIRNLYNGKIYRPDPALQFPDGWWNSFGTMLMDELDEVIRREKLEDEFRFEQIKEKFGQLRIYYHPSHPELREIFDKYEALSGNICIVCGQPDVPMLNMAWISPWCRKCYDKNCDAKRARGVDYEIPTYESYIVGESTMPNSYKVRRYSKSATIETEFDISETATKIREHWAQIQSLGE
jgi:hypothetical protein